MAGFYKGVWEYLEEGFKGHRGRPGKRGGSLPRNSAGVVGAGGAVKGSTVEDKGFRKTPPDAAALGVGEPATIQDLAGSLKGGGFTYHVLTSTVPPNGFMVSVFKGREKKLGAESLSVDDVADAIEEYIDKNTDLLMHGAENNHLGGWVYEGELYLDVSQRVSSFADAERLGKENNQISIFDLATFTEYFAHEDGTYREKKPDKLPSWLSEDSGEVWLDGKR